MAFSDVFQWPLLQGLYARNVVVRNPDGTIHDFSSGAGATAGTETRTFEQTFVGSLLNNARISQPGLTAASVCNLKMLRIESAAFSDIYFQVVAATSPFDAPAADILDVFAVRALESRTIEAVAFAAKDIPLPIGSELYLRISTSPNSFEEYIPTGTEGLYFTSVVTQV